MKNIFKIFKGFSRNFRFSGVEKNKILLISVKKINPNMKIKLFSKNYLQDLEPNWLVLEFFKWLSF